VLSFNCQTSKYSSRISLLDPVKETFHLSSQALALIDHLYPTSKTRSEFSTDMQKVLALLLLAVGCYAACAPATNDNAGGMWVSIDRQNPPDLIFIDQRRPH
jgi:hypothetical protein